MPQSTINSSHLYQKQVDKIVCSACNTLLEAEIAGYLEELGYGA